MSWGKNIYWRKSEVSIERLSVYNIIENLMDHGKHGLPCSYTNHVIDMLPQRL